ncbi:uncharacterized protein LOC119636654 [Glossina fuscipes]|uniref:Uncharacterized protein LOC119636654 n=2 Tax=Nemorhina TaxID=44051 RepID=A0A9C5YVB7_9MUSC|nr:uncharacterized protein LOC119636654 [Glossina fuscipes]
MNVSYGLFEIIIAFNLVPLVFIFLWSLIVGDFKNFRISRKTCTEFTAQDPVNCYQNFPDKKLQKPCVDETWTCKQKTN